MLVVFDIDGTLANIDHRLHFVRNKPKNWPAFDRAIPYDAVNEPVAAVYRKFRDTKEEAGHNLVLASGRNERSREATEKWLHSNQLHGWDSLYMRQADDYRPDDEIKEEILEQIVRDWGRKPDMVFDDRSRVVRMWRKHDIWVFDCNQSGMEF